MMSPRTLECLLWLRLLLTILVWGFFSLSNKNFFFFFFKPFYGSPVKLVDKQNLFLNLFFYWRIIALQNFIAFCQTSTWISHRYTYIPSLMNLPPSPSPSPLGWYRAPVLVSWSIEQIPICYFTYGNVSFHVTLYIHLTLSSPLPMSISLFSICFSIAAL